MSSLHPQLTGPDPWTQVPRADFAKDLKKAIADAFPTGRRPYRRVFVLLTSWPNDDMAALIEPDILELQNLFTNKYNYICKRYFIPSQVEENSSPELELRKQTIDLGQMGNKGDLLIFYYSGHGLRLHQDDACEIQYDPIALIRIPEFFSKILSSNLADRRIRSGEIDYSHQDANDEPVYTRERINLTNLMKGNLDTSLSSVLYLLDCCHAASAAIQTRKEIFAASSVELPTLGSVWTRCLTEKLMQTNGIPITAAQLHGLMMNDSMQGVLTSTPVHSEIGSEMEGSVVFAPVTGILDPYSHSTPKNTGEPKVLISVHMSGLNSPPKVEQWAKWLKKHTPSGISDIDIKLSGFHMADSNVLLVVIPTPIWVTLIRGAYSFVSFVKSGNLLLPGPDTEESGLSLRPRLPGVENKLPGQASKP